MYKKVLCVFAAANLAGCVTAPHPGGVEGAMAPRIVKDKHDIPTWTNVGSFGPIKAGDEVHAEATCATLDNDKQTFRAEGYHSAAIALNGEKFLGGGYYCVAKKRH